jgi:hypothetical protein
MTFTGPDVVSFIVIFLFWLLTVFLLSHRSGFRAGNRLLAVFLVSKTLCFLHGMLMRFAEQLAPLYPHAYYWGLSSVPRSTSTHAVSRRAASAPDAASFCTWCRCWVTSPT